MPSIWPRIICFVGGVVFCAVVLWLRWIQRASPAAPSSAVNHFHCGLQELKSGDPACAAQEFEAARLTGLSEGPAILHAAYARFFWGDIDGAQMELEHLLRSNPKLAMSVVRGTIEDFNQALASGHLNFRVQALALKQHLRK